MAESRSAPATDAVVLWLTGGPGCSSLLAAFTENGPCLVPETGPNAGSPVFNPYSWNSNATVIWLDQPTGVGFSYGPETDKDQADVAVDAYAFLQAFFKAHPALQPLPFFIFGESYGGHYAPSISYAVYKGNAALAAGDVKIRLEGVGIGNGLTVPLEQYPHYATLAYNYSIEKLGHPVVTLDTYETMVKELDTCLPLIAACQKDTNACADAQSVCNGAQIGPYEATGLNPYDIRAKCEFAPLCYDESHVTAFFNSPHTQALLGVEQTWTPCNYQVNGMFSNDWMKQFADPYLADQIDDGLRVLIYAGDVDFICNWLGNQAWALNFDWSGWADFNAAPMNNWTLDDGTTAGQVREAGGLFFLRVFDAGHMVPADQPKAALALLNTMISGANFSNF